MSYITEPILRELLWEELAEQNYEVGGEINIGNGIIDLVAKTPNGEYHGFEVKDQSKLNRDVGSGMKPDRVRHLFEQLSRYQSSRCFDRLYYCSQDPQPVIDRISASNPVLDIDRLNQVMFGEEKLADNLTIPIPRDIGAIKISLDDSYQDTTEVVREAGQIDFRDQRPNISRKNEAWVQHHTWKEIGVIREGVLPNPDESTEQRIDVIAIEGSTDPTEIYRNQEDNAFIGIEAKGAGLGSQSKSELQSQLVDYLRSGGLTHLYLAVPSQNKQAAINLLSEQPTLQAFTSANNKGREYERTISNIGLITVDPHGTVDIVTKAEPVRMHFDGLQTQDTHDKCKAVGFDRFKLRSCDEFDSVFKQEDAIHRKARKINVKLSNDNQELVEAKWKVQSGGKPTDREQKLIENEYTKQYGDEDA